MLDKLIKSMDYITESAGRGIAWLSAALVLVTCYDVTMRYFFNRTSAAMQELEWHLFAFLFLLAAGYALKHDRHVRVDVLYSRLSVRGRAGVDFFGTLLFTIPFCVVAIITSWPFVRNSWQVWETSPDPGGLPARFLVKGAIPLGFAFLLLQAIAMLLRLLQTWRQAAAGQED